MPLPPDNPLFNQAVGRSQPRLPHPTARNFDRKKWESVSQNSNLSAQDHNLCKAAIFYGDEIKVMRDALESRIFGRLSSEHIKLIGIAIANQQYFRLKLTKEIIRQNKDKDAKAVSLDVLRNRVVSGPAKDNKVPIGSATDSLVDILPHWLDRSAISKVTSSDASVDFTESAKTGSLYLSLEHALRDLWQQVLWEKSQLNEQELEQTPGDKRLAKLWQIWLWRNETLHSQNIMIELAQHGPNRKAQVKQEPYLEKTVIQVSGKSKETRQFKYGGQSAYSASQTAHKVEIAVITESYLANFLDSELPEFPTPGMTLGRLQKAWSVLRDAANVLVRKVDGAKFPNRENVESLALTIRRSALVDAVSKCADFSQQEADAAVQLFTCPSENMQALFKKGLWGCPLVKLNDTDVAILLAPLEIGSPPRRLEIWLDRLEMTDKIEKYGTGLPYEAHARAEICNAISKNAMLRNSEAYNSSWLAQTNNGDEEQIDLIFKLRNLIVVCEIKCLLTPTEPIERYDYLRKLEDAAEQATRKTKFIEKNKNLLSKILNLSHNTKLDDLRIIPLVMVNQGFGLGFDAGCPVVDLHFLRLFLERSSYIVSSVIQPKTGETIGMEDDFYSSEKEAEDKFEEIVRLPPTISRVANAFDLIENALPLSDRRRLKIRFFSLVRSPTPKDERDWLNAALNNFRN